MSRPADDVRHLSAGGGSGATHTLIIIIGAVLIGLLWLFVLTPLAVRLRLTGDARQAVAATFRDPRSTDFRRVKVWGDEVCGEVNAINGFGAFTGFRPFMWTAAEGADTRPEFSILATTPDMRASQAKTLDDWDADWRTCQTRGK